MSSHAISGQNLTNNALRILERRYLAKDESGCVIELPDGMFRRVAAVVSSVDLDQDFEPQFYNMMSNLEFLPNSPALMNAGTEIGQLSACFVIPVGDSMKEIFDAVTAMALIHQSGGGTGFSFSKLRPKDDPVRSTGGVASGPVSFMRIFDTSTEVIKQGGRRRGANMGILRVDHPDIMEFIYAKEKEGFLTNFNLSVAVTDYFMECLLRDRDYALINPRTKQEVSSIKARVIFDAIADAAWNTGDPGIIFIDEINRHNPTPDIGEIEATNPCGEQPLLPYESCNLGSINLVKMVKTGAQDTGHREIDWGKLRKTVHTAVAFMDNVIDVNCYPLPEIEKITKGNRKIGLGVMGFAEMLIMLGIPYDSDEALRIAEKIMRFISNEGRKASVELGKVRGSFPNFRGSLWDKKGFPAMRNATVTTIAPTGTISIISGTTSGIEPLFAVSYIRKVMDGTEMLEVNPLFEDAAKRLKIYSDDLMLKIAEKGSIQGIEEIPPEVQRLFVTALDIDPLWHVKMQAVFQRYTDNAVSKTVNLRMDSTKEDIMDIFHEAYRLKCKGITVFRYGSKDEQVFHIRKAPKMAFETGILKADSEYTGECKICSV